MKTVFLVPYGGLGNQLFQLAAALSVSNGGSVNVLRYWGFARENSNHELEIQSFRWGERINYLYSPKLGNKSKRLLNLLLRLGAENKKRKFLVLLEFLASTYFSRRLWSLVKVQVNRGLGFSDIRGNGSKLILGYFQSDIYVKRVVTEMQETRLVRISSAAQILMEDIKGKKVLIVHVRRGDYLDQPFGVLDNEYYEKAMNEFKKDVFDEIWVFSDDVVSAKQLLALKGLPHTKYLEGSGLSSAEIMEIMRHGSGFIIANSSFSWWSAQLKYHPEAKVVCPSPWFKYIDSPEEILDKEWVPIQW